MGNCVENRICHKPHKNILLILLVLWVCTFATISNDMDGPSLLNNPSISTRGIIITKSEKVVDLGTTVKTTQNVVYTNVGKKTQSNVYFIVDSSDFEHIALFSYKEGSAPANTVRKSTFKSYHHFDKQSNNTTYYKICDIALLNPLPGDSSVTLTYTVITTLKVIPYPTELPMESKPSYKYDDTINVAAIYPVKTQITKFICKDLLVISHSPQSANQNSAGELVYNINKEIGPYINIPFSIHFSNKKLYTSTILHRKVYISEYADVEFVESHIIYNHANKLVGEFSRSKYLFMEQQLDYVVKTVRFHVPKDSYNYYYRDDIGNISTSTLQDTRNFRIMDIIPRFPIMGGWNTEFTIKYKRPAQKLIQKQGALHDDIRQFTINLLGACKDIVSVDHFTLEIILPEYAKFVTYDIPTTIDFNVTKSKTLYYMDMHGRDTLIFESRNLVPIQNTKLTFTYQYNSLFLLIKPYYASVGFFILLFTISIISRSRMLSSRENNQTAKINELLEYLSDFDRLYKRQIETLKLLTDSIDSFKMDNISKKNFDKLVSKYKKSLSSDLNILTTFYQRIADIFPDCRVDLEKKLSSVKEEEASINEYLGLTYNFKNGTLSENEFLKQLSGIENKIQCQKIIVDHLFE